MNGGASESEGGSLHRLEGDQAGGVDPADNIWLTASAGTGKTQVLTGRVLRLLLQGVRPGAILGLTFTKAGAAEMAQRVRRILAEWVRLDDKALRRQLDFLGADHLDPEVLTRARTRFAAVIDAPGQGLAFQTIHSFCQSLLGAFPVEAGLTPGFRALEDAEASLLRRELLAGFAEASERGSDPAFLPKLSALAERLGEDGALAWLDRCAARGPDLLRLPDPVAPVLRHMFDLPLSDPADWLARWCAGEVDEAGWRDIMAEYIGWATPTGEKMANIIGDWLASGAEQRADGLATLLTTVFTKEGALRSDFGKKLAAVADLAERCGEAARSALHTATAMAASDRYAVALEAGRSFAGQWEAHKRAAGLVEFNDLIAHTLKLLSEDGAAQWIRYKLDQQIDHILVDEAQDTNAEQWTIIKALAEEYFAGEGTRDPATRTLFVVGDYKQAIFGFQGTDPANFSEAEAWFREKGLAAERPFAELSIATSYRCAPAILRAVDEVAKTIGPEQLGLSADAVVRHEAAPGNTGGIVTLWPVEMPTDRSKVDAAEGEAIEVSAGDESWIDDATQRVADRIALTVRRWIDEGVDGAEVSAGDVMVLVRSRKELAGLIVARLQARGVPVAGIDRLRLDKPLAVQDLLAAARFAVQPLDDLNLASLLVSPLGGFSQDDLWRHGAARGKVALWRHLRAQADLAERLEPLRAILATADYVSPAQFFETILSGPLQGRQKLLARLGNAARDPIEELVSQALAFGRDEGPSLHRFLRWFDARDNEIKRENDAAGDAVRVMTVHGAKGLEARFVILADAAADPDGGAGTKPFDWRVTADWTLPVSGIGKQERPAALAAAHDAHLARERREHWRLLYVAMTRAKEGLYVTGSLGKQSADKGPAADSWYAKIAQAMDGLAAMDAIDPVWGRTRAYQQARDRRRKRQPTAPPPAVIMPDWVNRPAPDEPRPLKPLAPSALPDEAALAVPMPPAGDGRAARRGTLIHALFERLPPVAAAEREAVAIGWLGVHAPEFTPAEQADMAAAVVAVIADPGHAPLFGPDALAEAPFSALVGHRVIAGTVDRLLVTDERVAVIDFKTGGQVPGNAAEVPAAYLRQMAAYRAALSVIFAGRRIEAALLYTGGPRLIVLPDDLLDAYRPDE